ncbi:MAG TPA: right-handed parallel beta-helix repeat-containing protein [Acidimicrobiia bacterium]
MSKAPIPLRILLALSVIGLLALALSANPFAQHEDTLTAADVIGDVPSTAPASSTTLSFEPREPSLAAIGAPGTAAMIDQPGADATTTTAEPTTTAPPPPSTSSSKPKATTTTEKQPTTTEGSSGGDLEASGPVTINNKSGVVIENLSISNPNGPCVSIVGSSNVTIRNSHIGPCGSWAVFIDRSDSVTVSDNTIRTDSGKGGVYGHMSSGIAVIGNSITRSGRNPIQFDKVSGGGNRIESNTITSSPAEDMISIYKSGGTSGSWLRIRKNVIKNNTGGSTTGSGIMLGDAGGGYILVEGNRLTDPGQAGIGVAGGANIRVLSNTVVSAAHPWSNVGIYVWNQYGGSCHSIEVRGNKVDWLNKNGQRNSAWNGGGCGEIAGWSDNDW